MNDNIKATDWIDFLNEAKGDLYSAARSLQNIASALCMCGNEQLGERLEDIANKLYAADEKVQSGISSKLMHDQHEHAKSVNLVMGALFNDE